MKIILSRKGFDSGSGGFPSPVLPDGTMVSLPIPEPCGPARGGVAYRDVITPYGPADTLLRELSNSAPPAHAHLDPDLDPSARPRLSGWRPSFGQSGAAAGHLRNQGVGPGDLFLFFGLFRSTLLKEGVLVFDPDAAPFHAIFGWLRVSEVLHPAEDRAPAWAADHPPRACAYPAEQHPLRGLHHAGRWSLRLRPTPAPDCPRGSAVVLAPAGRAHPRARRCCSELPHRPRPLDSLRRLGAVAHRRPRSGIRHPLLRAMDVLGRVRDGVKNPPHLRGILSCSR